MLGSAVPLPSGNFSLSVGLLGLQPIRIQGASVRFLFLSKTCFVVEPCPSACPFVVTCIHVTDHLTPAVGELPQHAGDRCQSWEQKLFCLLIGITAGSPNPWDSPKQQSLMSLQRVWGNQESRGWLWASDHARFSTRCKGGM
jgi:hypothetical protein